MYHQIEFYCLKLKSLFYVIKKIIKIFNWNEGISEAFFIWSVNEIWTVLYKITYFCMSNWKLHWKDFFFFKLNTRNCWKILLLKKGWIVESFDLKCFFSTKTFRQIFSRGVVIFPFIKIISGGNGILSLRIRAWENTCFWFCRSFW